MRCMCVYANACLFVFICVFQCLYELTQALCGLRGINQASATWPRWLWPSWAQLIRVPCGPDMWMTKKHEEWEEAKDRRTGRQWMIMMTRAILLASAASPPHPSRNPGLGPGSGLHMDKWSGVGEVSPPGRVWPVSCQGWQEETRGGV